MDFRKNRLELLAGLGNHESRHEIVREQAEELNESTEARQADESDTQVRQAVRRTIRKMVAEGTLSLENIDFKPGRAMEEAEPEEELEEGDHPPIMSGPMLEDEGEESPADMLEEDEMEEDCGAAHEDVLEEDSVEDVDDLDVMEESEEEAVIYEIDGEHVLEYGGKRYSLQEIQGEVDLDAGTVTLDIESQ